MTEFEFVGGKIKGHHIRRGGMLVQLYKREGGRWMEPKEGHYADVPYRLAVLRGEKRQYTVDEAWSQVEGWLQVYVRQPGDVR